MNLQHVLSLVFQKARIVAVYAPGPYSEHPSSRLLGSILGVLGFELILGRVKIIVVKELDEPLGCCNFFPFGG